MLDHGYNMRNTGTSPCGHTAVLDVVHLSVAMLTTAKFVPTSSALQQMSDSLNNLVDHLTLSQPGQPQSGLLDSSKVSFCHTKQERPVHAHTCTLSCMDT